MRAVLASLVVLASTLLLAASAGPSPGQTRPMVFGSDRADGQRDLYVVNEDGSGEHRLTFDGNEYFERSASWSPDGMRIAYAARKDGNFDIYTIDANGGNRHRVTTDPLRDDYPHWTNDGRIIFTRNLFGCPCTEWVVNADGTGARQLPLSGNVSGGEVAPHGSRLVYSTDMAGAAGLHVAQLGTGDQPISADHQITAPPSNSQGDFEPHWSPNGNDIVFLRDHGGSDNDIYVVHADGTGLRQLTNTASRVEFWATWSSDGREVIFQDNNSGKLRAISVATGEERPVATSPTAPLIDDFSDGVRDASLWHQVTDPGSSIAETDGRLIQSISGSAVPGGQYNQVFVDYGSQCNVAGDFDMQVDYALLTWPHLGGFRAQLAAFFANASINRASVPIPWAPSWGDEQVQGWADGGGGQFKSSDSTGTFRLVRDNGIVTGYVKSGTSWRPVFSGDSPGDAVYGISLFTQAADFGHLDGSVAFDNFKLTSGNLTCPDWWHDFFPAVFYG